MSCEKRETGLLGSGLGSRKASDIILRRIFSSTSFKITSVYEGQTTQVVHCTIGLVPAATSIIRLVFLLGYSCERHRLTPISRGIIDLDFYAWRRRLVEMGTPKQLLDGMEGRKAYCLAAVRRSCATAKAAVDVWPGPTDDREIGQRWQASDDQNLTPQVA